MTQPFREVEVTTLVGYTGNDGAYHQCLTTSSQAAIIALLDRLAKATERLVERP